MSRSPSEGPEEPVFRTVAEPRLKILIPAVVACAMVMESLDQTIITTSIPQMAVSLGESPLHLNVAITSYLLSLAVFIPVSGWIADRFGARSVFCSAVAVFTLGSVLCGAATSLPMLVATRILQGLGGALMTPVGRLVILKSFPKSELLTAMTYVAIPALLGPACGPLVGGFLTTYVSWRWIFYINVPFGALGLGLALRYFDDFRGEAVARFDFLGFALCGIGLSAVQIAIEFTGRQIIPIAGEIAILAVAVVSLALYGLYARRAANPAVDLKLFRIKTFRYAVLVGGVFRTGLGSTGFLLPLLLQLGLGYTAFHSGVITALLAIGTLTMRTLAAKILRRFGFRRTILINGGLLTVTMATLSLIGPATPVTLMIFGLMVLGFFRTLQMTAMNTLGYADLNGNDISPGTSVSSVGQQLSQSFGVAISASLLAALAGESGVPSLTAFHAVFFLMALLPAVALTGFLRLTAEDGRRVSG